MGSYMVERDEDILIEEEDLPALFNSFRPNLGDPVEKALVNFSESKGVKIEEAARNLYILQSKGLVELVDPNPPSNFVAYLLSQYNLFFWIIYFFITLMILSSSFSQFTVVYYLRAVVGFLFIFFIPGFCIAELLFPNRTDFKTAERLIISIGLSVAAVSSFGFILNYTFLGLKMESILFSSCVLVFIFNLLGAYRKYKVCTSQKKSLV